MGKYVEMEASVCETLESICGDMRPDNPELESESHGYEPPLA